MFSFLAASVLGVVTTAFTIVPDKRSSFVTQPTHHRHRSTGVQSLSLNHQHSRGTSLHAAAGRQNRDQNQEMVLCPLLDPPQDPTVTFEAAMG